MKGWDVDSEAFHEGLRKDPVGCGAGWARIAIATRKKDPLEALDCAKLALQANPDAWRDWFVAFTAERDDVRESHLLVAT
jgi:hypothetical protein